MIRMLFLLFIAGLFATDSGKAQEPSIYTDITGYELSTTSRPERIVSLIPSNTELLFAVGAGQSVVGVTNYCNYPPEVKKIDRVGDLMSLSVEKIVSLKPDLVLATGDNPDETIKSLRTLGIRVFVIDPQTVDDVMAALNVVGAITGHTERAEQIIHEIDHRMAVVRDKLNSISTARRPSVFVGSPQRTENWTPGPGTFTTDIIEHAGGRNVADELSPGTWAVYTLEKIVSKNPDVILSTVGNLKNADASREKILETARNMAGWRNIEAIKQARIAILPDDWLLRPGPRMIDAIEHLARTLHPDLFNDD